MSDATELSAVTRTERGMANLPKVHPWGAILVLSSDWRVDAASENIRELTGIEPGEVLGQPAASVFTSAAVHAVRNRLALLGGSGGSERLFNLPLTEGGRPLDLLLHAAGRQTVIEVFLAADPEEIDVAAMAVRMASWIEGCDDLHQLGDRAAHAIRGVIGCDSVSIWNADGDGPPKPVACYARDGFECPRNPKGAFAGRAQFLGACDTRTSALLVRESAPVPDLSGTLLGSDLTRLRDYICSNGGSSGFLLPVTRSGQTWGWIAGVQRHERSLSLARLSVIEVFERLFAAEVRRLEPIA